MIKKEVIDMDCKFCGAPMEDGQELCPDCGKNVTEETAVEAVEETVEEPAQMPKTPNEKPAPKKKKGLGIVAWIVAIVLAAAVAFGGYMLYKHFVKDKDATSAAQMEGNKALPTEEELAYYYWDAFIEMYSQMGMYATFMMDPLHLDTSEAEAGKSWQVVFMEQAISQFRNVKAVCDQAAKEGFVLPEADQKEYDEFVANMDAEADFATQIVESYGPASTKEGYKQYIYERWFLYYAYMTNKQNTMTFTDEEMAAYYDSHAAEYAEQGIVKTDGNEAKDSLVQAEEIYDLWLGGEQTEDSFALLATEHTTDPGSKDAGGLYENVFVGQMVAPFEEWCFDESRQYGDTGIVETEYGHHIMYFVAKNEDGTVNVRHILTQDIDPNAWKSAVHQDMVEEAMETYLTTITAGYAEGFDPTTAKVEIPKVILDEFTVEEAPATEEEAATESGEAAEDEEVAEDEAVAEGETVTDSATEWTEGNNTLPLDLEPEYENEVIETPDIAA